MNMQKEQSFHKLKSFDFGFDPEIVKTSGVYSAVIWGFVMLKSIIGYKASVNQDASVVQSSKTKTLVFLGIVCLGSFIKVKHELNNSDALLQQNQPLKGNALFMSILKKSEEDGENLFDKTLNNKTWWNETKGEAEEIIDKAKKKASEITDDVIDSIDNWFHGHKDKKKKDQDNHQLQAIHADDDVPIDNATDAFNGSEWEIINNDDINNKEQEDVFKDEDQDIYNQKKWEKKQNKHKGSWKKWFKEWFGHDKHDKSGKHKDHKKNHHKKGQDQWYNSEEDNRFSLNAEKPTVSIPYEDLVESQKSLAASRPKLNASIPSSKTISIGAAVSALLTIALAGCFQFCMSKYATALKKFTILKEVHQNPNAKVVTPEQAEIVMKSVEQDKLLKALSQQLPSEHTKPIVVPQFNLMDSQYSMPPSDLSAQLLMNNQNIYDMENLIKQQAKVSVAPTSEQISLLIQQVKSKSVVTQSPTKVNSSLRISNVNLLQ